MTSRLSGVKSSILSANSFAKRVVKSRLVTTSELKTYWDSLHPNNRPRCGFDFAKSLVSTGLLTDYQAFSLLTKGDEILKLGEYSIEDTIGEGGMGQVFLARHRRMKRVVALKLLHHGSDPETNSRFEREIEALAKLAHPNIVTAYDAGYSSGKCYLVMEYIPGVDLRLYVKRRGPLTLTESIQYLKHVSAGLVYAHNKGIVHRDVKPANMLLDESSGNVKLLDLGLARIESPSERLELTRTRQAMGTIDFMAPEQANDAKTVDARSDVYSLGISMWFLLTGDIPYPGETIMDRLIAHRSQKIPSLVAKRSDVPNELDLLFQCMVAKHPKDRCQSVAFVLSQLEKFDVRAFRPIVGSVSNSCKGELDEFQTLLKPQKILATSGSDTLRKTEENVATNSDLLTVPKSQTITHSITPFRVLGFARTSFFSGLGVVALIAVLAFSYNKEIFLFLNQKSSSSGVEDESWIYRIAIDQVNFSNVVRTTTWIDGDGVQRQGSYMKEQPIEAGATFCLSTVPPRVSQVEKDSKSYFKVDFEYEGATRSVFSSTSPRIVFERSQLMRSSSEQP